MHNVIKNEASPINLQLQYMCVKHFSGILLKLIMEIKPYTLLADGSKHKSEHVRPSCVHHILLNVLPDSPNDLYSQSEDRRETEGNAALPY
jgi:hypothetical protein